MTEDEKQIKAYAFVDMMVDRGADYLIEGAPMWYGWALTGIEPVAPTV